MGFIGKITNAAVLLAVLAGCGQNVFKKQEKKDPAEDATLALEKHDETTAITTLETALADDPDNPQLLSILALAYAQRAGIEPVQFAQRMAANQTSSDQSSAGVPHTGDYTALFSVMPAASAKNLSDLDQACSILETRIPAASAQPGDKFKLALYQTASFILHTKALDTNGDGQLTLDEILNLSSANASGLIAQLAAAAAIFGGAAPDNETQQKAAQAIAQFQDKINAAPGATPEEKLKNYLAASGAASAATSDAAKAAAAAAAAGGTTGVPGGTTGVPGAPGL